jgi:septal ring factor EnvC (AmiA/AmiB activator)
MQGSEAMKHTWRAVVLATVMLLGAVPAAAQDNAGRAAREREALRRTQAALKQSQEQQAALAREKAELSSQLASQRDSQGASLRRTQSQLNAAQSEAAKTRAELARVSAELAALRGQAEVDSQAAQARTQELVTRLDDAARVAAERTRTAASLTALLERATQTLAAAEKSNREMHAYGLQLIDEVRGRASTDASAAADPVLGLRQVRIENRAEALRDGLDALKLPAQARP